MVRNFGAHTKNNIILKIEMTTSDAFLEHINNYDVYWGYGPLTS